MRVIANDVGALALALLLNIMYHRTLVEKCQEKGWQLVELAIQPDHLHLFVRVWSSDSASEVVKELKGITSFHLRQEFKPILSTLPSLWTRSYFACTVGQVSAEGITACIAAQKGV